MPRPGRAGASEGGEREADAEPDERRECRAHGCEVVVVLEVEVREDEKRADGREPHADPEPTLGRAPCRDRRDDEEDPEESDDAWESLEDTIQVSGSRR